MRPKNSTSQIDTENSNLRNIGLFFKESKLTTKNSLDKSFEYEDIKFSNKSNTDECFKEPLVINVSTLRNTKNSKNTSRSTSCAQNGSRSKKTKVPKCQINIENITSTQPKLNFVVSKECTKVASDKENKYLMPENQNATSLKNPEVSKNNRRSSSCHHNNLQLKKSPKKYGSNSTLDTWLRKSKRCQDKEKKEMKKSDVISDILSCKEEGLTIIHTAYKGRGIESTRPFYKDSFVVEYAGDLITEKEAKERESEYAKDEAIGSYMFYFMDGKNKYCVDATRESGRLGRLLNHSKTQPNCRIKAVTVNNGPRLVIVAKRDIEEGEELVYDYGDRDKATIDANPWLKL